MQADATWLGSQSSLFVPSSDPAKEVVSVPALGKKPPGDQEYTVRPHQTAVCQFVVVMDPLAGAMLPNLKPPAIQFVSM
jgi:hypothetical protein